MSEINEDLKKQVLKILLDVGEPMTSSQIFASAELADDPAGVAKTLASLRDDSLVSRAGGKEWVLVDVSKAKQYIFSGENQSEGTLGAEAATDIISDSVSSAWASGAADRAAELLVSIKDYQRPIPIDDLQTKLYILENLGASLVGKIPAETARELTERLLDIRNDLISIAQVPE